MAIYSRFGIEVKIVNYCQKSSMVEVQDVEDGEKYKEIHIAELKADGGIHEIQDAIHAVVY